MSIPTSRAKAEADIRVDESKCIGCGLCVSVCNDRSLIMENRKARVADNPFYGCYGCGHCMAICPSDAIEVVGRTLSRDDLIDLDDMEKPATYGQLHSLLQQRRSIREFRDKPVEKGVVERILESASTAPMGLPPSDVNVLVFDTRDKVRRFAEDFCQYLDGMKWFVSDWFLFLMRPFWGKVNDEVFRSFVKPLFSIYINSMRDGINLVTYDAPLAMYFYGSPYSDPADSIVAATYAMVAAETLGLGTCMIGGVHPLIQKGRKAKEFREAQGIKYASREGLFLVFGYPEVEYRKGIRRTFASVEIKS